MASIPISGGRSLHPVKNWGSFGKVADQTSLLFFTGQSTPLTKLPIEREQAQNRGENLSQKLEELQPKTAGEVAPDFDSRSGG